MQNNQPTWLKYQLSFLHLPSFLYAVLYSLSLSLFSSFASEKVQLASKKKKKTTTKGGAIPSCPSAALHCRSHEGKKQMFEQTFLTAVPRGPAGAPDCARLFRSNDSHNLLNPCGTFQKYFAWKTFLQFLCGASWSAVVHQWPFH